MWRMLQEVTAVRRRVLSYRMGRKKKKYIFPLIGEQLFPLVSHSLWKLSLRTCYCTFYKWVSPKDGRNMFFSGKISVFCTQKIRYFLLPIYCHWCRFRTFCILTQKGSQNYPLARYFGGRVTTNFGQKGLENFALLLLVFRGSFDKKSTFKDRFFGNPPKKHLYKSSGIVWIWPNLFLDLAGKSWWDLGTVFIV